MMNLEDASFLPAILVLLTSSSEPTFPVLVHWSPSHLESFAVASSHFPQRGCLSELSLDLWDVAWLFSSFPSTGVFSEAQGLASGFQG